MTENDNKIIKQLLLNIICDSDDETINYYKDDITRILLSYNFSNIRFRIVDLYAKVEFTTTNGNECFIYYDIPDEQWWFYCFAL